MIDRQSALALLVVIAAVGIWELFRSFGDYKSGLRARGRLRLLGGLGLLLFALFFAATPWLLQSGVGLLVAAVILLGAFAFNGWIEAEMDVEEGERRQTRRGHGSIWARGKGR